MNKLFYKNKEYEIKVSTYTYKNGEFASDCAVALMIHAGDTDEDGNKLYDVVTVALGNDIGNDSIMGKNCSFVDDNNFPGIVDFSQPLPI